MLVDSQMSIRNKVRVVQACTGYPPDRVGGVENVVRSIVSGLPRSQFSTTVLTRLWRKKIGSAFVTQLVTLPGEATGYFTWALSAAAVVLGTHPDILHCHGLEGAVLCNTAKLGVGAKVMHVHNSLSREEHFLDSRMHRWGYELQTNACMEADVVVCPTSVVRDDIMRHLPAMRSRDIVVIPNPVDVGCIYSKEDLNSLREKWGLVGKKVILYFGKIKRSKGVEEICQAYETLPSKDNIKLVIAGAPTTTGKFFAQLQETYPDVIFTGFVKDPAIFYQIADLFCIYTAGFEGGETFAVALAQAMRQKVPVVCSDNPIFHEVTNDAAFFAKPHDPDALSEVLSTAFADPIGTKALAERAFRVAEKEYAPDVFVARLQALYSFLA